MKSPQRLVAVVERWSGQAGDLRFRARDTDRSSPNYVTPEDRIAVFDQDGTRSGSRIPYTNLQ